MTVTSGIDSLFAEIGQVLDAGQQAQQELDQLLVRRAEYRLLGNRCLSQPFQQPEVRAKCPQTMTIACCIGLVSFVVKVLLL